MKTYQFREMTTADVQNELKDSQEALENYRFQHATGTARELQSSEEY